MEYHILAKSNLDTFIFQQTKKPMIPVEPDLLLEMSFSPKLFIIKDIAEKVEDFVKNGVQWLDARVDCSLSEPKDDKIEVYEYYRTPFIHQTYKLTDQNKQEGKLNWIDIKSTKFDFSKLKDIPLEERLIFKLDEDYGIIFIHQSVIDLLKKHIKDVWIRVV